MRGETKAYEVVVEEEAGGAQRRHLDAQLGHQRVDGECWLRVHGQLEEPVHGLGGERGRELRRGSAAGSSGSREGAAVGVGRGLRGERGGWTATVATRSQT